MRIKVVMVDTTQATQRRIDTFELKMFVRPQITLSVGLEGSHTKLDSLRVYIDALASATSFVPGPSPVEAGEKVCWLYLAIKTLRVRLGSACGLMLVLIRVLRCERGKESDVNLRRLSESLDLMMS